MHRPILGAAVFLTLAACAAVPADEAPDALSTPKPESRSLLPGTIGAVVAPAQGGVRVEAIAADGPAARAGLRVGDLIVHCGSVAVTTTRAFNRQVLATRPGERLRLDVRRDAQPLELQVEVMQLRTALRL
jgi:S1-C subfamily serine protease